MPATQLGPIQRLLLVGQNRPVVNIYGSRFDAKRSSEQEMSQDAAIFGASRNCQLQNPHSSY